MTPRWDRNGAAEQADLDRRIAKSMGQQPDERKRTVANLDRWYRHFSGRDHMVAFTAEDRRLLCEFLQDSIIEFNRRAK